MGKYALTVNAGVAVVPTVTFNMAAVIWVASALVVVLNAVGTPSVIATFCTVEKVVGVGDGEV
jgi:hypothetical protein